MNDWDDAPSGPRGVPPWIVTFGDLMSLLLCFFVLLWSFSEMDVRKFRAIASSLHGTLGTAGGPAMDEGAAPVASGLIEEALPLEIAENPTPDLEVEKESKGDDVIDIATAEELVKTQEQQQTEQLAQELAQSLAQEIRLGKLELIAEGKRITLRIRENGSFPSGSADLQEEFMPVLEKIKQKIAQTPGDILVAGHTDNVIIDTPRFRSNWELSAARAVSVAHELLKHREIPASRLTVSGYADTHPLAANDSEVGRTTNRRVEIILQRP